MLDSPVFEPGLLRSVPLSARADARIAMGSLSRSDLPLSHWLIQDTHAHAADNPEIFVAGELIQIPTRIHYSWPRLDRTQGLSQAQLLILSAWMSRHSDGWVRQRALAHLLVSDAPWTIPFVIQLCGEYVIEIGQDILQFITQSLKLRPRLQAAYLQFAKDNSVYIEVTKQRAMSYWNDDYRGVIRREEYPQLSALRALDALTHP